MVRIEVVAKGRPGIVDLEREIMDGYVRDARATLADVLRQPCPDHESFVRVEVSGAGNGQVEINIVQECCPEMGGRAASALAGMD